MLLVYLAGETILSDESDPEEIAYSEAKAIVEENSTSVQNVVFFPGSKRLEMELTDGTKVEASYPSDLSALEFERLLDERGVRHEARQSDGGGTAWWSILTYLLPFVLFGAFWIFLIRRHQGKGQNGRRGDLEGEARDEAEQTGTDPWTYR